MIITLYKNCKLNSKYDNVFSFGKLGNGKTPLQEYLGTLQSVTLTIASTYQDKSGTIVLDSYQEGIGNVYDYNYARMVTEFEDGTSITRYCFIDSITVRNELCYVSYSEDIWHSYGSSMKVEMGMLSRNRLADKPNETTFAPNSILRNVPIEYDGNNTVNVTSLETVSTYNVIAEIQTYRKKTGGELTNRYCGNYIIKGTFNIGSIPYDYVNMTYAQAEEVCANLIRCQATEYFTIGSLSDNHYDVSKLYIVPSSFNVQSIYSTTAFGTMLIPQTGWFKVSGNTAIQLMKPSSTALNLKSLKTYTITNNYKRLSVGIVSRQIPIVNNGTTVELKLNAITTDTHFQLFINVSNQFYDVTEDFEYTVPFTSVNAVENSQRVMTRGIQTIGGLGKILTNTMSGGLSSAFSSLKLNESRNFLQDISYKRKVKRPTMGRMSMIHSSRNELMNIRENEESSKMNTGFGITSGLASMIEANVPIYSSNKAIEVGVSKCEINNIYGACSFVMTTDNDTYITKAIDNIGFIVYEYVYDFNKTGIMGTSDNLISSSMYSTYKYNAIKFDYVNLYGNFPTEIREMLEDILAQGTKVWFNENVIQ